MGDLVQIFPDNNGILLLISSSLSLTDVVRNQGSLREIKIWKTIDKIIDQTSLSSLIRSAIKRNITPSPWPYHPSDVSRCDAIPKELEQFLVGLLTGNPDTKSQTSRVSTLVQSFSQDMIYAVTGVKHKPPKHLLRTICCQYLTENIEIIKMLNKFGHGVSYSVLEENDTALCLQKLAAGPTQRVVIPVSIHPNVFVNLAWDNIDRLEETLTGKGTSHRVNGIVVQAKVYGPFHP